MRKLVTSIPFSVAMSLALIVISTVIATDHRMSAVIAGVIKGGAILVGIVYTGFTIRHRRSERDREEVGPGSGAGSEVS